MSATDAEEGDEVSRTPLSGDIEAAPPVAIVDTGDSHVNSNGGTLATAVSQPADKSKGKVCGVCNDHEARYKCSRCQLPYCSVACATLHRATHPAVTDETRPTTLAVGSSIASNGKNVKTVLGTLSAAGVQNHFSVLDNAKELQTLFMIYPRLRSQLRDIYSATLPPLGDSLGVVGQHESYSQAYRGRGRARGRGRNNTGRERGSWNTDRGTQEGIDALCEAKEQYGKSGEGVREYSELVLKLVSMEGMDVARLVQEQVAEENAEIIAQLLNGDSF